jgi:hypothetical protein
MRPFRLDTEPWHCPAAFDILSAAAIFSEKGCFQEVAHEKTSFLIPTLLLMAGCARVISDNSMQLVDRNVTFAMLHENRNPMSGSTYFSAAPLRE